MDNSTRRTHAESQLAQVLRDASGFDLYELNPDSTFLELGFDSLFLIQFSQRVKSAFGVKVTFRQLIEEYPNIKTLVDYLAANASDRALKIEASAGSPATSSSAASTVAAVDAVTPAATAPISAPAPAAPLAPAPAPVAAVAPQASQPPAAIAMPAPTSIPTSAPAYQLAPATQVVVPLNNAPAFNAISASGLEQIISQQHQIMSMQLQLLRERRYLPAAGSVPPTPTATAVAMPAQTMPAAPLVAPTPAPPPTPTGQQVANSTAAATSASASSTAGQKKVFERFGPYKPIRRSATGGLTDSQQQHLDQFIARFTKKTTKSRTHAENHRNHFADPRGVAGYRRIWKSMVYQISVDRSQGSKLWDIDGNEYIDIAMGFGLNLFGQSPDFVTKALHEQLDRGVEVGPQSPLAGEVAKLLCEFSRMDRATFCNTGSEAVMAAMRIARTVTGKTKCVFFNKDYHGNFDQVLLRSATVGGKACSSPAAPGVPQFYADNTIVLEYGTDESLRVISEHADDIAAVLVEPVQSADPDLHPREFIQRLRQITKDQNIVMVMDEVISGFRAAPGGAQEYFGVWGDMATYGKVLGGGLPIGALAGKAEYMDALDGGSWKYADNSEPEADMTFFAGTFVRHPLAMTAAYQILMRIKEEGPQLQQELSRKTARLAEQINGFFVEQRIPIRLARFTSLFRFIFPPDLEYADMLYYHLLDRGIFTRGWGDNCFLSTAHSDADIQRIIDAVKESCLELRRAGFLPEPDGNPPADKAQTSPTQLAESVKNSATVATSSTPSQPQVVKLESKPFRISCLEEIQEEGELPPIFCMPAADGLTLVYHELSNCLGKNQPMYGLNSPGVFGEPVPDTIEEMAERFVEDILEFRPDGPYLLAGYCSGGTIALEVAQQLIARGKQVAFLAGVETYNWCTAQSSQLTTKVRTVYGIQRIDFHVRNFFLLPGSEKWKFLKAKWEALLVRTKVWRGSAKKLFSRSGQQKPKPGEVNHAEIWRLHDLQADRYHPQVYPGKFHLFRPKQDYRSYIAKEEYQAEKGIEVIRLPVYPAGLMVNPYVSQLAELFEQGIREGLMELDYPLPEQDSAGNDSTATIRLHAAV